MKPGLPGFFVVKMKFRSYFYKNFSMTTTGAMGHKKDYQPSTNLPDQLVRDVLDGVSYYYKGYQEVLNKTKKPEDIMPCSGLQAFIIQLIQKFFYTRMDFSKYTALSNEVGNRLGLRNKVGLDLAFFEKSILTPDKIDEHFITVLPKVIVEVDVKVDTRKLTNQEYIQKKTDRILEAGVEKVIWILTKNQTAIIAEQGAAPKTVGWDTDIELLDGHHFNIRQEMLNEGFDPDKK